MDGNPLKVESPNAAILPYDELPTEAKIEIVTEGGWDAEAVSLSALPTPPTQIGNVSATETGLSSLEKPFAVLTAMDRLLDKEQGAEHEQAFVRETLRAIEAWRMRMSIEPGAGHFRPMTPEKREAILRFYENAALDMYRGFAKRMASYAQSPDAARKRLAELFGQAEADRAGT